MKLGDSMGLPEIGKADQEKYSEYDVNDKEFIPYEGLYDEDTSVLEKDDEYVDHGLMINAEVLLPQNG